MFKCSISTDKSFILQSTITGINPSIEMLDKSVLHESDGQRTFSPFLILLDSIRTSKDNNNAEEPEFTKQLYLTPSIFDHLCSSAKVCTPFVNCGVGFKDNHSMSFAISLSSIVLLTNSIFFMLILINNHFFFNKNKSSVIFCNSICYVCSF